MHLVKLQYTTATVATEVVGRVDSSSTAAATRMCRHNLVLLLLQQQQLHTGPVLPEQAATDFGCHVQLQVGCC